jgi:formate hydrogenlyase transcriptional activator
MHYLYGEHMETDMYDVRQEPSAGFEQCRSRLLLDITNAIIQQRTRGGLFEAVSQVLHGLYHFDHISLLLIQSEGSDYWSFFSPALGVQIPGFPQRSFPVSQARIPRRAMQEQRTIIVDCVTEPENPECTFLRKAGLRWVISTPLVMWDAVIGSIQICYRDNPALSREEIILIEQVARQIAIAVENMLAYERVDSMSAQLQEEKKYLQREIATLTGDTKLVYRSEAMGCLMQDMENVASTDSTVFITGETGTGKDLVARCIHDRSARRKKTFVKINCAALVPTLIESELFGHEKGAFTGASARRIGRFEIANDSTLFLDEITELPLNLQAKLLQVLQEGTFERVGGTQTITTTARIIAATNQNMRSLVSDGRFRSDLFYRLNIFPIEIPPLRERKEDIPVLGRYLGESYCERLNRPRPTLSTCAVERLLHYDWPGNVRELQNFIERVIILKSGQTVTARDIDRLLQLDGDEPDTTTALALIEKQHIEKVLRRTRGKIAGPNGAAVLLGMKRGTLQYRIKKCGIDPAAFR